MLLFRSLSPLIHRPVSSQFLSANSAASAQREHSAAPVVVMSVEVSHGRGGAGNINADDTQYVDGEVVRSGPEGSHGDGAYSAGRGGESDCARVFRRRSCDLCFGRWCLFRPMDRAATAAVPQVPLSWKNHGQGTSDVRWMKRHGWLAGRASRLDP